MKNPSIFVRFAGRPLIACLFFAGSGLTVYGWYEDHVVWWCALAAVLTSLRTVSAIGTLRRYKAWRGQWDAMGKPDEASPVPPKHWPWKGAVFAVLLLLIVPALCSLPAVHANVALFNALRFGWLALGVYCLFRVLRRFLRGAGSVIGRERQSRLEKSMDTPIEFAIGRASGCPTRASAERSLPDYCLRLMGRG